MRMCATLALGPHMKRSLWYDSLCFSRERSPPIDDFAQCDYGAHGEVNCAIILTSCLRKIYVWVCYLHIYCVREVYFIYIACIIAVSVNSRYHFIRVGRKCVWIALECEVLRIQFCALHEEISSHRFSAKQYIYHFLCIFNFKSFPTSWKCRLGHVSLQKVGRVTDICCLLDCLTIPCQLLEFGELKMSRHSG